MTLGYRALWISDLVVNLEPPVLCCLALNFYDTVLPFFILLRVILLHRKVEPCTLWCAWQSPPSKNLSLMLSRARSASDLFKAVFTLFVKLLDNLFFNLHAEENYVSAHILQHSSLTGKEVIAPTYIIQNVCY